MFADVFVFSALHSEVVITEAKVGVLENALPEERVNSTAGEKQFSPEEKSEVNHEISEGNYWNSVIVLI